jgi:hypothetical protein
MRASVIAYWAAKAGNTQAEYEDAWQVNPGTGIEVPGESVVVAVADGATESMLARLWAAMIADGFAASPDALSNPSFFAEKAIELTALWPATVDEYTAERENTANPLRWYERAGIGKGAFAAVLALRLSVAAECLHRTEGRHSRAAAGGVGRWICAALGDTCVFHVRGGQLTVAFPVTRSADFDRSPALLGSLDVRRQTIMEHVRLAEGEVAQGDDFFVCTDALACWFLGKAEEGGRPWETLRDLDDDKFTDWLSVARETHHMRNDDVTLVHVDVW